MRVSALVGCVLTCGSVVAAAQQAVPTSSFSGDLSAQIAAADRQLGGNGGLIVIDHDGEATGPVTLSRGHGLRVNAAAKFDAPVTLGGDNDIQCNHDTGKFVLNLANQGNFLQATRVNNVSVQHCTVTAANPGGSYIFLYVRGGSHIRMVDNRGDNVPLLFTTSVDGTYAQVTPETQSHDILLDHNTISLPGAGYQRHQATGFLLQFTTDIKVTHNEFSNGAHGVQYWGGDGNHDWKSEASPRWLSNLEMSDNDCHDVRGSCFWGGMGQHVQFLRNRAQRCGDACLDVEDNKDTVLDGNTSVDGGNGEVALLGRNVDITIRNNKLTSTSAKFPIFSLFNNSVDAQKSVNITVEGNTMVCEDRQTPCEIKYENAANLVFDHNQITNAIFVPKTLWQQNTRITNNTLTFTLSASAPFAAIDGSGQILGNTTEIANNVIRSEAPQPAGSACISIKATSPRQPPGRYDVEGNTCGGSVPFGTALSLVNAGQTGPAAFTAANNSFEGRVVKQDLSGGARFDVR